MTNDLNATTFGASACSYAAARPRYPASLFDWIADLAPAKRLHGAPVVATGKPPSTSRHDSIPLSLTIRRPDKSHLRHQYLALIGKSQLQKTCGCLRAGLMRQSPPAHFTGSTLRASIRCCWLHCRPPACSSRSAMEVVCCRLIQQRVLDAYADLKPYWSDGNRALWRGYRDLPFPLEEINAPPFSIEVSWMLNQWLDYTCTWSAYQRYMKEVGRDPREQIAEKIAPLWGKDPLPVSMPLTIRAGRRPN